MEENGDADRSSKRKQKRPFKVERSKEDTTLSIKTEPDEVIEEDISEVLEDIPQFLCVFCPKTFSVNSLRGLDQHVKDCHNSEIYCSKCKEMFENVTDKINHEMNCNNDQPFHKKMEFIECVFCKHLYRRDKLKRHIDLEHNDEEGQPKKVSKKSKNQKNSTATSILDILTNGNKVNLTQASLTLKEKILNFNKKLNLVNEENKTNMGDVDTNVINIEKDEELEGHSNVSDVSSVETPSHGSKINIVGLKNKLKISLKNDNE